MAGSLPSLRRLIMHRVRASQAGSGASGSGVPDTPLGLVTFGGSTPMPGGGPAGRKRSTFRNPTDGGVSVAAVHARGDGDWRRLQDDGSSSASSGPDDKDEPALGRIRADYTYDVDISPSPHATASVFRV